MTIKLPGFLSTGVVCAFLISACGEEPNDPRPSTIEPVLDKESSAFPPVPTITRFAIATGACEGMCPVRAFEADSDMGLKYFGGMDADPRGDFRGRLDKVSWQRCIDLVQSLGEEEVVPWQMIYDCPEYELVAIRGADTLHVRGCSTLLGSVVALKLDSIITLLGAVPLQRTSDKPDFLTWTPGPIARRE